MLIAYNNQKKRISSDEAIKGEKYTCPVCGGEVILRKGVTNIPHFAHKNIEDCDLFSNDMSEWHSNWQKKFPIDFREKIIRYTFDCEDKVTKEYNLIIGKEYIHRADVCINNYVIEFQHSAITKKEFMLRNYFYARAGYKVIWVFDLIDECLSKKLNNYDVWHKYNNSGDKWKWSNPSKVFSNISPQRNKTIKIFIQFSNDNNDSCGYIGLITWAPDSKIDSNLSDYSRFFTSYSICDFDDLYNAILNNQI